MVALAQVAHGGVQGLQIEKMGVEPNGQPLRHRVPLRNIPELQEVQEVVVVAQEAQGLMQESQIPVATFPTKP